MQTLKTGYVSRNFTERELRCKCGKCEPIYDWPFIDKLQALRTEFERPLIINSWYRCEAHNKTLGGAKRSQHMRGNAVDISIVGWSASDRYKLIRIAVAMGFRGLGIGKTFIHIDGRPKGQESTWTY